MLSRLFCSSAFIVCTKCGSPCPPSLCLPRSIVNKHVLIGKRFLRSTQGSKLKRKRTDSTGTDRRVKDTRAGTACLGSNAHAGALYVRHFLVAFLRIHAFDNDEKRNKERERPAALFTRPLPRQAYTTPADTLENSTTPSKSPSSFFLCRHRNNVNLPAMFSTPH